MANPALPVPPTPANDVGPIPPAVPADQSEQKTVDAPPDSVADGTVPGESVKRP